MGQAVVITPDAPTAPPISITPDQDQETQHRGFWATAADDLKGLLHPSGFSPYPGMDQEAKSGAATQHAQEDLSRKAAGYSLPYRIGAPIAQAAGANVPGMEKSAAEGDVGGVLGHAAAPMATILGGEALAHGAPAVTEGVARGIPKIADTLGEIGDTSNLGAKAKALAKLAGQEAISHVPVAGRVVRRPSFADVIDAVRTKAPEPGVYPGATEPTATPEQLNPSLISEARTLPGQISPERIIPAQPPILRAQPIPPRSGLRLSAGSPSTIFEPALDATGENKPFAGGMDEMDEAPTAQTAYGATPATTAPPAANAILSPIEATQTPKGTLTNLKQQINDALGGKTKYEAAGGKPLEPGVSLKNQRPQTNLQQQINDAAEPAAKQTPKAPQTNLQQQINNAANPLPDGFTATPESSALRGYKYDPDAQHFEVITNTGERFGRIGITPDQVEAFAKSESKGRAWPALKNAPGAIPTKNGAPRTVQTSYRSASPDDVSPEWQKSVDYLKAKKASKPN